MIPIEPASLALKIAVDFLERKKPPVAFRFKI
jgi:hypothetical protein